MITQKEFLERWDSNENPLGRYDAHLVSLFHMPEATRKFLLETGLPKSTPPFLSFRPFTKIELQKIAIPLSYFLIGFTGNGDYICIKDVSGKIIVLSHEDYKEEYFMNSSLSQMLEFILDYSDFIEKIIEINGEDAYLDNNAPPEFVDQLIRRFKEADDVALQKNSFWDEELDPYR